jgi:hypothetical protein
MAFRPHAMLVVTGSRRKESLSMPVAPQIVSAATSFDRNRSMLQKSFSGLTPEEWAKRPNEHCNNILWIAGHIVWARSMALKFLQTPQWTLPWLDLCARGAKLDGATQFPSPDEVLGAFADVTKSLTAGLEGATEEMVNAPAPPNAPPGDGKVSGVINFLAYHETYHVGQVAYLRCWLGHAGPQG